MQRAIETLRVCFFVTPSRLRACNWQVCRPMWCEQLDIWSHLRFSLANRSACTLTILSARQKYLKLHHRNDPVQLADIAPRRWNLQCCCAVVVFPRQQKKVVCVMFVSQQTLPYRSLLNLLTLTESGRTFLRSGQVHLFDLGRAQGPLESFFQDRFFSALLGSNRPSEHDF